MLDKVKEVNVHNIWRTCNKIRAAVNRTPLNFWNCFKPYDPQQTNLISASNFLSLLTGPLGNLIGLSNQEACDLAEYFRTQDGRIFYSQLCTIIHTEDPHFENNFPWVSGEEWDDPLQTNCLSQLEERRLEIILTKIASHVNSRKLVLKPYFQDYELISKNCGVVTVAHFARVLHFLNITLASEEMHLLIKKFAKDNYTINYVAFTQTIEEIKHFLKNHGAFDKAGNLLDNFPGRVISVKFPKLPRPEVGKIRTSCVFPKQIHFLPVDTKSKRMRGIDEIILRIQDHVYKNQIKVSQYFQDFDVFNGGRITENQFLRGLDILRQSALGKVYLAKEEIEILLAFYKDPNDMERICWRTFEDDIGQVFTIKHLQKHPNCKVETNSKKAKNLPREGYQEWDCTSIESKISKEDMKKIYDKTMQKIKYSIKGRRFSINSFFRDFDNLDGVDYWQLSKVLEQAMAQEHLEKYPLVKPIQHVPSEATPRSFLNFDERQILLRTLNVLTAFADSNWEDLFKDFDKKLNTGTVTRNQLFRAFTIRNVMSAINANELDVLFKCFSVGHLTTEPVFHYRSFLNALHILRINQATVPF